jgi:hypothetical protein
MGRLQDARPETEQRLDHSATARVQLWRTGSCRGPGPGARGGAQGTGGKHTSTQSTIRTGDPRPESALEAEVRSH